jgi:hypothetical protein
MKKIRKQKLTNYYYIHQWNYENHLKSGYCVKCHKEVKTEWALIHGKEHQRGIENYMELCIPCHRKYDAHPAWNKGLKTIKQITCEHCHNWFIPRRKTTRFCSNRCSAKGCVKWKILQIKWLELNKIK